MTFIIFLDLEGTKMRIILNYYLRPENSYQILIKFYEQINRGCNLSLPTHLLTMNMTVVRWTVFIVFLVALVFHVCVMYVPFVCVHITGSHVLACIIALARVCVSPTPANRIYCRVAFSLAHSCRCRWWGLGSPDRRKRRTPHTNTLTQASASTRAHALTYTLAMRIR